MSDGEFKEFIYLLKLFLNDTDQFDHIKLQDRLGNDWYISFEMRTDYPQTFRGLDI